LKVSKPTPAPWNGAQRQALERAVSQIERAFGKGSIMRLDDDPIQLPPGISTGSISLDLALGGRGIPRGRVVEIFGPNPPARPPSPSPSSPAPRRPAASPPSSTPSTPSTPPGRARSA
jgi:hypothetical protein